MEASVLATLVTRADLIPEAIEAGLTADTLASPYHAALYRLILGMYEDGAPVNGVTVLDRAIADPATYGGVVAVAELTTGECFPTALGYYVAQLVDRARRRALLAALDASSADLADLNRPVGDVADALVAAATSPMGGRGSAWTWVGVDAARAVEQARAEVPPATLRTGFRDLDAVCGGLWAGDLVVVAGRPSMGKTAFALNLAVNVADNGGTVGIVSLEMERAALVQRLLASLSKVPLGKIRAGTLCLDELAALDFALQRLRELRIYVDDTPGKTVAGITAAARSLVAHAGALDLLIVDYVQLVEGSERAKGDHSREQEVAAISRRGKVLAKALTLPVVFLAQLNRKVEERKDKRPILSDLRESGALEQDADQVWALFRGEVYWPEDRQFQGRAEVAVLKNRQGRIGTADLTYDGSTTTFGTVPLSALVAVGGRR